MSLLQCIEKLKISTDLTEAMTEAWNKYREKGMDVHSADRRVLADFAKQLTARFNELEKAAGLQPSAWISTARKPAEINASIDWELKRIKPDVKITPAITTEEFWPVIRTMNVVSLETLQTQKSFQGTPVEFVSGIRDHMGRAVAFRNVDKGQKFLLDAAQLKTVYGKKGWTTPRTMSDGSTVTPLPESFFSNFDEFLTFALLHEHAHSYIFRDAEETIGEYEDRINSEALYRMGLSDEKLVLGFNLANFGRPDKVSAVIELDTQADGSSSLEDIFGDEIVVDFVRDGRKTGVTRKPDIVEGIKVGDVIELTEALPTAEGQIDYSIFVTVTGIVPVNKLSAQDWAAAEYMNDPSLHTHFTNEVQIQFKPWVPLKDPIRSQLGGTPTGTPGVLKATKPKVRMLMDFADGTGGRKMRPENRGKSTMDLILEGKRTATSRAKNKMPNLKVGDIVEFYDSKGRTVLTQVTKAPYPMTYLSAEEWSALEGWDTSLYTRLKEQDYLQIQYRVLNENQLPLKISLVEFIQHSGGALGSDITWSTIGAEYGLIDTRHYWHEKPNPYSKLKDQITVTDATEGAVRAAQAAAATYGYEYKSMKDARLIRNWAQVKYSDAVFAIGTIVNAGERLFPNLSNDTRLAKKQAVSGGTGYAVEMAIQAGKPVFVYDQKQLKWFTWDGTSFLETDTPVLTLNFAGIGTRNITDAGKDAIRAVYEATVRAIDSGEFRADTVDTKLPSSTPTVQTTLKTYKGAITTLADNQVFVFGANDQGRHGRGSAGDAMGQQRSFQEVKVLKPGTQGKWTVIGEHSKITVGTEGKSYPMVTVEGKIERKNVATRMAREKILKNIQSLYETAATNPGMEFLIAYSGANPKDTNRNGYTNKEMAELFSSFPIPENVVFEERMAGLIENMPVRFLSSGWVFEDQGSRTPLTLSAEDVRRMEEANQIQILDVNQNPTGKFFTTAQRIQATNSILYQIQRVVTDLNRKRTRVREDVVKAAVRNYFQNLQDKLYRPKALGKILKFDGEEVMPHITQEIATEYATNMDMVLNSFEALYQDSLARLTGLGIILKNLKKNGIEDQDPNGDLTSVSGRGLESFNDKVYMINPQDTASGDLKLYIAMTEQVELGPRTKPKMVTVPLKEEYRTAIAAGVKTATFRTEEQLKEIRLSMRDGFDRGLFKVKTALGDERLMEVIVRDRMTAKEAQQFNESENKEEKEAKAGDIVLEFRPYVEGEQTLRFIPSFIGTYMLSDFEAMFQDVTGLLADREPSFDNYVAVLEASNKLPLRRLAERLKSDRSTTERQRLEFVQVMSKTYAQYGVVSYKTRNKQVEVNSYNANNYSARKVVIENWKEAQKMSPIMLRDASGNFSMNPVKVEELRGDYERLKAQLAQAQAARGPGAAALMGQWAAAQRALVEKMLAYNGIELTKEMLDDLYKYIQSYTENSPFGAGNVFKQWGVTEAKQPTGIFSAFLERLLGYSPEELETDTSLEQNNPLYNEQSTMEVFAKVFMKFSDSVYNSSHRNRNGDTIWDYTLSSYMDQVVRDLVGDDATYRNQLRDTFFARNSWLLAHWESNPADRKKLQLFIFESLTKYNSKKNTERSDMSDREQLFFAVNMMANQGRKYMHHVGLTHSDKSKTLMFRNVPRTEILNGGTYSDVLMKRLYSVYESEFDRIAGTTEQQYDSPQFDAGKKYFYLLPQFNYDRMKAMVGKTIGGQPWAAPEDRQPTVFTEEDLALFWTAPNVLNTASKALPRTKEWVDRILQQFLVDESAAVFSKLKEEGIVTDSATLIDKRYLQKKVAPRMGLQNPAKGVYRRMGEDITEAQYYDLLGWYTAMDFAMNSFLMNASIVQLMTGDPAMAFKDSVEKTLIEYEKRLAGHIAPGKVTEWEEQYYDAITLADFELDVEYLSKINPAYKKVELTDAQEFVTVEEHLDTLYRYGNLDKSVYDEMKAIIKPGEFYEFTKPEHLEIVMQISKPVYYGKRTPSKGVMLNDYVKSSAMVLYPGAFRNTELDKLRVAMEKTPNLRRAHFKTARKVGFPKPSKVFNDKGEFLGLDAAAITPMDRRYFRIQQEVPYDEEKHKIQVFTQANKLITADLPAAISVKFEDGRTFNRTEIRRFKEEVRMKMIKEHANGIAEELGARIDYDEDGNLASVQVLDKAKMMELITREARDKNYSPNELAPIVNLVNDMPLSPVFFSSLAEPIHNLMMSLVDKMVKIKVTGKSYVQASSVGISRLVTDGSIPDGVIWVPGHDGKALRHMRKQDGTVEAAEVLVPFSFFAGNKKLSITSFLKEDGTLDTDKLPLSVLQMIGVRIPTSKQNSMLPMRVVGFLPENMGDTIIVPEGITVQMGSDFDVDKLFVYQRPYNMAAEGLRTNPGTEEDYFQVHWGVLTNPDMFEAVTSPLDKSDLKDEAARLGKAPKTGNFFGGYSQAMDYNSQKDAKTLVGFAALMNTFMAVVQPLNLRLAIHVPTEDGKVVEQPDPISTFKSGNKVLDLVNISGYGTSEITDKNGRTETRTKMDNINIILSEVLDHAKHRTIDKLNITVHSFHALAALMSLETADGKALNLQYGTRLLMQPYVRKYVAQMSKQQDIFSTYNPKVQEEVLATLFEDLEKKGADPKSTRTFDDRDLLNILNGAKDTAEYYTAQHVLLSTFSKLLEVGRRMSEMAAMTNQDVNGTGGSLFAVLDKYWKRDDILGDNIVFGGSDILAEAGKGYTEKGMIYDLVTMSATQLFADYLPHQNIFLGAIGSIKELMGVKSVTQIPLDVKRDVLRAVRSFVYSNTEVLGMTDPTAERARLLLHTPAGPSLAERVHAAKSTWGKTNVFLTRLMTSIGSINELHSVSFIASKMTRLDDQDNVRAWNELLISEDKEARLLGEDLIRYAFLTGGNQDANSFVRYVPFDYMVSRGWFAELTEAYKKLPSFLKDTFLDQWIRHNPERALQIEEGFVTITGARIDGVPESFRTLPVTAGEASPLARYMIPTAQNNNRPAMPKYLQYRSVDGTVVLYRKENSINGTENGVEYFRVDTLGSSITDEYNAKALAARSIVPENRALNSAWTKLALNPMENPVGVEQTILTPPPGVPTPGPVNIPEEWKKLGFNSEETSLAYVLDKLLPAWEAQGILTPELENLFQLVKGAVYGKDELLGTLLRKVNEVNNGGMPVAPEVKAMKIDFAASRSVEDVQYAAHLNTISLPGTDALVTSLTAGGISPLEILAHELTHGVTWGALQVAELEANGTAGNTYMNEILKTTLQEDAGKSEELINAARAAYKIWKFVKDNHSDKFPLNNRLTGGLEYGISNVHEFVVAALTKREFQEVLNEIQMPNQKKSVLVAFFEALSKLLRALAPSIEVKEGSVLMEILPLSYKIVSNNTTQLVLLNPDIVKYHGQDVVVGVDKSGQAVDVSHHFMWNQPEPLRQMAISEILSQYNKDKDIDAGTKQPFRGTLVVNSPVIEIEQVYVRQSDGTRWLVTDTRRGLDSLWAKEDIEPDIELTQVGYDDLDVPWANTQKIRKSVFEELIIDGEYVLDDGTGPKKPKSPAPPDGTPLGKYELFPGVFANQGQREAIDKITEFLETGVRGEGTTKDRSMGLFGAGGTGKTTIIKKIVEQFPDLSIAFAAPSHNAVVELKKALKKGDSVSWSVSTVQSEVRMRKDNKASFDQGKDVFVQSPHDPKNPKAIETADVVIIDESSMLDDQIMSYLEEATFETLPLFIFMGDYAQLPPIGQATDAWPIRELRDKSVVLTENMRTSKADISAMLQAIRNQVDQARAGGAYSMPIVPFANRVASENVSLLRDGSSKEMYTEFVKRVKEDPKNFKHAIMIMYRNDPRKTANQAVRTALFGDAAQELYTPGDWIIFNQPMKLSEADSKVMLKYFDIESTFNMQRAIVTSYKAEVLTQEVEFGTMDSYRITAPGVILGIDLGPDGEHKTIQVKGFDKDYVNRVIAEAKAATYDKARGGKDLTGTELSKIIGKTFVRYGEWKDRISLFLEALKSASMDVDYAYAVTSHKSQGSTFDHVFVDELDIAGVTLASEKDKVHSYYTGVSRTKEHVYILHPRNPATVPQPAAATLNAVASTIANGSDGPWTYRSEAEAKFQVARGENLFGNVTFHLTGSTVSATPASTVVRKIDRTIEELTKHKQVILDSMTLDRDKAVLANKRLELDKIDADIALLKLQGNLDAIHTVGDRQISWAEQILAHASPSATDIMTAWKVASTWANIIDILYSDHPADQLDEKLSAVSGRAKHLQKNLLKTKVVPAMISLSDNRLRTIDFTAQLKDMTGFATYALSLNRAASQLTQEIDLLLKNAARGRDFEIQQLIKNMETLDKEIEAYAAQHNMKKQDVFEMFIQKAGKRPAFGLVQQFSQDWYDKRGMLRATRTKAINALRKSANANPSTIAAQWTRYWQQMLKIGVYADVSKLFDPKSAALLSTPESKAEQARLLQELGGSQELLDKMLKEAETRFASYLDDADQHRQEIDKRVALGQITAAEAYQANIDYEERYSPFLFMSSMRGALTTRGQRKFIHANEGDRYAVVYPKAANPQFFDSSYAQIKADKDLDRFYSQISGTLKTLKRSLPLYIQWEMHENFLPVVEAHLLHDMSAKEYMETLGTRMLEGITGTEFEEERKGSDRIPLRFITKNQSKIPEYSRDLVRVLEMFGSMALHYKHFSQVKDAVDMGEMIIRETDRIRRTDATEGEVLTNTLKALEYAKSYIMFKNPRKLEGNTGLKIYSLNPKVQAAMAQKAEELMKKKYALEQELLNPTGARSRSVVLKELEAVNEELQKMEGRNVYLSKVGDRLIGFNQLKALAFNPFSGFANMAFGIASAHIYATGRTDFTPHDMGVAMKIMNSSTIKWLTFGERNGETAQKIMALMDKTGMLTDIVDTQYGETNLNTRKNRLKRNLDPYTLLRSSDYYTKGLVLVATMLHTKVKVKENGVEKEVSLWEAYDSEGNWKFDPEAGWSDKDVKDQESWEKFRNRAIRVGQIIMGNMDKNSPKFMNKFVLGRLIGQFRASWLPEGWAARWEDEKYDVQLDRTIKGRYRTYMDLGIGGSARILLRQFAGMFVQTDAFEGVTINGKPIANSDVDMENMRRNFTGLMWTLSLMGGVLLIKMLLSNLFGDDDDDNIAAESMMIILNMMNRVNQDLKFYSSPDVANNLIRNAIPAFDVITDYGRAIEATEKALRSEDYDWDQALLKWTKATPYLNQINRLRFMTTHDISTISR